MTLLSFDGRNVKAIDRGFSDVYYTTQASVGAANIAGNFSTSQAYKNVSHAFHCVNIRASEVSRVPIGLYKLDGTEVTNDPAYKSMADLTAWLYRCEASRCLYGRGYGFPVANADGFQVGLEWGASPSLTPRYNPQTRKLAWFDRLNGSMRTRLELENVIYVWNFNPDDENEPGPADLGAALGAASVLYALDSMIAAYINSGGVKVTVFPVDPSTQDADYKAFQNWLNRRISGVRNAYRNVVMRLKGDLKPIVIGSDLKDMAVKDLSAEKKDEIAIALDIPPNVVDGSYKYATADSEYFNFISGVIVPRTDQTLAVLNKQWFSRFGLYAQTQPEKIDIMQTAQLAQSTAITGATGKPIMTVDEGRIRINLKPMGGQAAVLAETLNSTARLVESNTTDLATNPQPVQQSNVTAGGTVKPVPVSLPAGKPRRVQVAASPQAVTKALTEWRKGAIEAVKTDSLYLSNDQSLPHELRQALNRDLMACKSAGDVRAAFERHWPKLPKDAPEVIPAARTEADGLFEMAAALREATKALQESEK